MLFWIVAAILTFAASAAVIWPFLRAPARTVDPGGHDVEVYRDQLAEIDRDRDRGVIADAEAEEARAEIGRRILREAAGAGERGHAGRHSTLTRIVATVSMGLVPVIALAAYAVTGSPGMPDQRLAERLSRNPADNTVEELVARAETHLRQNPQDAQGWEVVAPIYLRIGRFDDAVLAAENAIRLAGEDSRRLNILAEARVAKAGGVVTAEALALFEQVLALDPDDGKARFHVGLARAQEGDRQAATAAWHQILSRLPADSPWHVAAGRAIRQVSAETPAAGDDGDSAGPDDDAVAAAAEMSDVDRLAMIDGMVSGLAERLRANPDDPAGWRRLVRSYLVLDRVDEARAALESGIEGMGESSAGAAQLRRFAAELGISETATE